MAGWAIDGVGTSGDARRELFASKNGAQGICGPADLMVRPLATPGGGVRVAVGSGIVNSKYGSAVNEAYMGAVLSEKQLTTVATGSSSARSDLVVLRVKDPFATNSTWPVPTDITTYDGFPVEIIQNVPSTTTALTLDQVPGYAGHTGLVLARLDFPKGTGTVDNGTGAKIVDLRKLAVPQKDYAIFARPRIAADSGTKEKLTALVSTGGEYFPGGMGIANSFSAFIPAWCTHMVIDAKWIAVHSKSGKNPWGYYWMEFGDEYRARGWGTEKHDWEFATQGFSFNFPLTGDDKSMEWTAMDEVPVPAKLRGKTVYFAFKAGLGVASPDSVWMGAGGGLGCRLDFAQQAIGPDMI